MLHFESFLSGVLTFYAVEFISIAITNLYVYLNNHKSYGLSRSDFKLFTNWLKKDLGISYKMFLGFDFRDRLAFLNRFNDEVLNSAFCADE
jgi:hypothetical protein